MKSIIQTPTPNLQASLDFYQKLNFKILKEQGSVWLTDGRAVLEINPDPYARAGLKVYRDSWEEKMSTLDKLVVSYPIEDGRILSDAGSWVYLMEGPAPVEYEPTEKCFGLTGQFAGLSIESVEIEKSMFVYMFMGFEKSGGSLEEGWLSLENEDGFTVSLMKPLTCPHLFFNPSLTYFNGEANLQIIQNIRTAGIPIKEEITQFNREGIVDNIYLCDPGGVGAFVFSD